LQGQPQPDRLHPIEPTTEPARLGKYEILERIGQGGFGVVYKGFDPHIQRFVAIKTCTSPDPELQQRYTREARIAGQLDHPNIVRIFDFGIDDGTPFLVQEFLSGEDLDAKIGHRTYVPQPERLLYLIHIARGLQYAHHKGVIHRDVKPANIRILDDGTAKIMDFGVAMLQHSDTRLTAAGTTMGTAAYLAPEQIRGEQVDGRTDIFSFGILAYELVTGERPFGQETISAILYEILNDDPSPITLPASVCPEGLRQLIFRCLDKKPDRRYPDCGEVIRALESVRETLKTDPGPRDLTTALRKSSSGATQGAPTGGVGADRTSRQSQQEVGAFDPVIRHEWTPTGIAIPKRRAAVRRFLLSATALLGAVGTYAWLGTQGIAPWPEDWRGQESSSSVTAFELPGDEAPVLGAVAPRVSEATSNAEDPEATAAEPTSTASDFQAEPEPTPEPETPAPVPEEATLTVAASWHPDTTVSIDNGRPMKLSKGRSIQLEPGGHKAVFSLSTPDYSARQTLRLEVAPGEQRTLKSPIQRPGQLTVQASLGSPQGLVAVDGNLVGSSPLRGHKLSPGPHRLDLYPLEGATAPLATSQLDLQAGKETVVTFDLTGRQELSVRNRDSSR